MSDRSIKLLIDGYNVLFQSPLVGKGRGAGWLQRARHRQLVQLAANLDADLKNATTVIYDASESREHLQDHVFDGIQIRFATEYAEADDLIEELIRRSPQPKLLEVVSSDQRIRRCARARRAQSTDAEAFMRQLEQGMHANASRTAEVADAHPDAQPDVTPDEVKYWLQEFGGLGDDQQ